MKFLYQVLFCFNSIKRANARYTMNGIVNKFLLAGYKYMREMHLRQTRFTYSACGPFTKTKERIRKFKGTGDSRYIYQVELDKACFQHDTAYEGFKDLMKQLRLKYYINKAFNIAKI